jgi:hypothetical protein
MSADLTLYEITDTLPVLLDSLEMTEPDTPERAECEADIARYMEALPAKVDGIAQVLAHFDAQTKLAAAEVQRLERRKARFKAAKVRLEAYCMAALDKLPQPKRGPKKLEGATSTLSLCKCPDALRVTDEKQIPAEFLILVPASSEVDTAGAKQALQMGISVPGAELVNKFRLGVS